jgi:magnesium transporter
MSAPEPQHVFVPVEERIATLVDRVSTADPGEVAELLEHENDDTLVAVITRLNPAIADETLWALPELQRQGVLAAAPAFVTEQWVKNHAYPEDSIGRLMDPPVAVFQSDRTCAQVIEELRPLVKKVLVTYGWIIDAQRKLVGVLVFRELLFASPDQKVSEIMVPNPFSLSPDMDLSDAMKVVLKRHFPAYPVSDNDGRLVGIVRGQSLFEQQAFEISAQAGNMVGVDEDERLMTPWTRSLKMRHPWLQLNLATAFIAAFVVGVFEGTLEKLVVLAVFLPVLAGQSGNTGCQALAVVLRAMTLGELKEGGKTVAIVAKEALLGFLNGALVGVTAGIGMFAYATMQKNESPLLLAFTVFVAMIGSCTASGIAGAIVPLTLKRLGADPATASSIFLTTATDVASMGMFLGIATLLFM